MQWKEDSLNIEVKAKLSPANCEAYNISLYMRMINQITKHRALIKLIVNQMVDTICLAGTVSH